MSFIDSFSEFPTETDLGFSVQTTSSLSTGRNIINDVKFGIGVVANLVNAINVTAELTDEFEFNGFLRLNSEANIFAQSLIGFGIDTVANANINASLIANIKFDVGVETDITASEAEKNEVQLTIDVVLPRSTSQYQEYKARLLINDIEIPITSINIDAPKNSVGETMGVTLSRPSDKSLLVEGATFELQVGEVIDGTPNWITLVSSESYNSKQYGIGWGVNQPNDQVTFSTSSYILDKLNRSPSRDIVFYDPYSFDLSANDFEQIWDMQGNLYLTTLIPIASMNLYDIFQQVFVDRCGFTAFKTNIPDYHIKRLDIAFTNSYYSAVSSLIGIFEPLFFEKDGVLWIIDTTMTLPPGFPDPRSVTTSDFRALSQSKQQDSIEAFKVSYSEDSLGWDYYTYEIRTDTNYSGSPGTFNYVNTSVQTKTREYRRNSNPGIIIKTDVESITTTRIDSFGHILSLVVEKLTYDGLGTEIKRVIASSQYVPIYMGTDVSNSLELLTTTVSKTTYAQHPYEAFKRYKKRVVQEVTGLFYIDPDKYLGDTDYKQLYSDAHLSGNITENGRRSTGPVSTRIESTIPLPNNEAERKIEEWNFMVDPPVLVLDKIDREVGSIGIDSVVPRERKIIVSTTDVVVLDDKRKSDISIGEIPITIGIALVRRLLDKRKNKNHQLDTEIIGIDWAIHRGSTIKAIGRNTDDLGNYMIEGYQITLSDLGKPEQYINMSLKGTEI